MGDGDGVEVAGDGLVAVEERVEVGDVVDVVDEIENELKVVLSVTMVDESDVGSRSDAELGGPASLIGRFVDVNVGVDAVSSILVDVDDEGVAESGGSTVVLTAGAPSSGTSNGDPVPSQYKVSASGPPHTCDASPLHAMLQSASEICFARPFNRSPQKHSPAYSVPARL